MMVRNTLNDHFGRESIKGKSLCGLRNQQLFYLEEIHRHHKQAARDDEETCLEKQALLQCDTEVSYRSDGPRFQ